MSVLLDRKALLPALPNGLRNSLFEYFNQIARNFREHRWEPSELNGGKLCEVIYTILKGHIDGSYPPAPSKPSNLVDACRALEQAPSTFSRSVRIQIPRMLIALYEIRNNRGVGHVGGDVDPNHMDAVAVLYMSKWLVAEVIRVFHGVSTETAHLTVEALVERTVPVVWVIGGKHRVLNPDFSMREKTLVLLYQIQGPVAETDLIKWLEHSNPSIYRRDVLRKLHRECLVEYDEHSKTVVISPTGVRYVEESVDLDL